MAGQRNNYGKRSSNSHSYYGGSKRHNPSSEDSGFDGQIVIVYSSSKEMNSFRDGGGDLVCPAQHVVFLVHDRVVAEECGRKEEKREEEDKNEIGEVQQN
ncbi:hypothetical protein LINPERPRIM_LOCUS24068 [Linum perenne]